jgi:hypothetical protein
MQKSRVSLSKKPGLTGSIDAQQPLAAQTNSVSDAGEPLRGEPLRSAPLERAKRGRFAYFAPSQEI